MAWQVLALKLTGPSPLIRDPTADECVALGPAELVRGQISVIFPRTEWSGDPTRGHFLADDDSFTLNFHLNEDPVKSCMIDVRGGSASVPALVARAKACGWQLYDCSAGWIDLDNPSYAGWQGYDRIRQSHLDSKGNVETSGI